MKSEDIKQRNYEKIKSTSSVLFFIQGIEATNMYQIAAASGISKVSIYKHFESKYDIAREIVLDRITAGEKKLAEEWEGNPGESGECRMRRVLEKLTMASEEDMVFYALFLEYAMYLQRTHASLIPSLFDRFDSSFRALFMAALEKGRMDGSLIVDGTPEVLYETITSTIRGACMLFFLKNAGNLSDNKLDDLKRRLKWSIDGFMLMMMPQ